MSFLKLSSKLFSPATLLIRSMSSVKSDKLKGKVAIVTAATDGIGYSIAKNLAENGAAVVISSRKLDNVKESLKNLTDEGLDVCGTVCHVGKDEDRKKLVEFAVKERGGIDIFVSNAATNPAMGNTLDCSEEMWDKIFDVNVKSAFLLTKLVVPHMQKRKGGSIVYVSSIGAYQPIQMIGAYSVSKTALLGLTRALAVELGDENIRVNGIAPGIIRTKFSKPFWENPGAMDVLKMFTPMKRIGEPDEIGKAVLFLCSDDSSYLTGETIPVAGGYYSRL